MVKAFFTAIIALIIVVSSSFLEQRYLKNTFSDFKEIATVAYNKTEEKTAVRGDILAVQNFWLEKKKTLHIFIPHNDIKEFDLWAFLK